MAECGYEGLYTDEAGAGLLFRISVPDCTDGEAQCFQKSRGIFGFMVAFQMVWFALKTQAGSFDASFRKFSMDMAGRTMGRLALAGQLSALKLVFVDGQVVCAVRTLTIERDWSVRLGGWLDDVPFRDDLETILEVENGVMESLTTDDMVLLRTRSSTDPTGAPVESRPPSRSGGRVRHPVSGGIGHRVENAECGMRCTCHHHTAHRNG